MKKAKTNDAYALKKISITLYAVIVCHFYHILSKEIVLLQYFEKMRTPFGRFRLKSKTSKSS